MGLSSTINNFSKSIKTGINDFLKNFKPSYSVNTITYFVIPGAPLKKKISAYRFGRGELVKAKFFLTKLWKRQKN